MNKKNPKVILLEFLLHEKCNNDKSALFPYFQSLLEANNIPVHWICFYTDLQLNNNEFFVSLNENELNQLKNEVNSFKPTHIIANEQMKECITNIINSKINIITMSIPLNKSYNEHIFERNQILSNFLSDRQVIKKLENQPLINIVSPNYKKKICNSIPNQSKYFIKIIGNTSCYYCKPINNNPFYQNIDLSNTFTTQGCSFCNNDNPRIIANFFNHNKNNVLHNNVIENTINQLNTFRQSNTYQSNKIYEYDITDTGVFFKINQFIDTLIKIGFPTSIFGFSPRIDEFYRMHNKILAVFPKLQEYKYSIHILRMGIENFSETENLRLNKGYSLQTIKDTIHLLNEWSEKYKNVFSYNEGFGFILFTPWTTLHDLEINFQTALELNYYMTEQLVLVSSLWILPNSAIAELAKKDNLITNTYWDIALGYYPYHIKCGQSGFLPWRFKDKKVACLYKILIRICAYLNEISLTESYFPSNEPEYLIIKEIVTKYRATPINSNIDAFIWAQAILDAMKNINDNDNDNSISMEVVINKTLDFLNTKKYSTNRKIQTSLNIEKKEYTDFESTIKKQLLYLINKFNIDLLGFNIENINLSNNSLKINTSDDMENYNFIISKKNKKNDYLIANDYYQLRVDVQDEKITDKIAYLAKILLLLITKMNIRYFPEKE